MVGDEAPLVLAGPGGRVRVRLRLRTRKGVGVVNEPMTPEQLAFARRWVEGFKLTAGRNCVPVQLLAELDRLSAQVVVAEKACNDEPHDDKSGYCVACTVLEAMECASHRTGEQTEVVDTPTQTKVVDLVAALRASVEAAKARRKAAGR